MPENEKPRSDDRPKWAEALREYQWKAAQRIASPAPPYRGQVLAFPPGFGKTHTALGAFRLRLQRDVTAHPCLVVVSTALSRTDWGTITKSFWPEAHVHLLLPRALTPRRVGETDAALEARRDDGWRALLRGELGPGVLVANYESLHRINEAIAKDNVLLDMVVLDEAHHVKRRATGRAMDVRPLVGVAHVAVLMTGTPIHNRPVDLYNLLDLSALGHWGSLYTWAERYFAVRTTERGYGRSIDELVNKARLAADTADVLFSTSVTEAYGALPATIRKLIQVQVKGVLRVSPAKLRHAIRTKGEAAVSAALRSTVRHKLAATVELVQELNEPVVLYTYQRSDAEALGAKLNKAGVSATVATGALEAKKRSKLIDEWKASKCQALVCTMDAVRESATLTRAAAMIFVDLDWLPGKMLQCEGRIHPSRQPEGERRPARYYYLVVENGPDEVVAEVILQKIAEMAGLAGTSEDAEKLATTLQPVQKVVDEVAPADLLSAIVARLDVREARLAAL